MIFSFYSMHFQSLWSLRYVNNPPWFQIVLYTITNCTAKGQSLACTHIEHTYTIVFAAIDKKLQQIWMLFFSHKEEMQQELPYKLEKFQKEVTSGQESTLQQVVKKFEKPIS